MMMMMMMMNFYSILNVKVCYNHHVSGARSASLLKWKVQGTHILLTDQPSKCFFLPCFYYDGCTKIKDKVRPVTFHRMPRGGSSYTALPNLYLGARWE